LPGQNVEFHVHADAPISLTRTFEKGFLCHADSDLIIMVLDLVAQLNFSDIHE